MNQPGPAQGGVGAKGIVLLGVAALLGILLLQAFDTGGGGSAVPVVSDATTTTLAASESSVPVVTTTTLPLRSPRDVKVLVVNATGRDGVAKKVSEALAARDYNVLSAVTATTKQSVTSVQFDTGYEGEARAVAALLDPPVSVVGPISSPPVKASDIRGASVIVLLGTDIPVAATTTTTGAPARTTTTKKASTTTTTKASTTTTTAKKTTTTT